MNNFKELDIWKLSFEFTNEIYMVTKKFPQDEMYGLTNQIRRAIVSVSSNIAEGSGRNSNKYFKHFLHMSLGSAKEVECQLMIAQSLNYISEEELNYLVGKIDIISGKIFTLAKRLGDVGRRFTVDGRQ